MTAEALGVIRLPAAGYQQAETLKEPRSGFSPEPLEGIQLTPRFRASDRVLISGVQKYKGKFFY